jgi:hypothetical protein
MDIVRKTLRPLARAAHLFFRCQLKLQLRGGVRVQLAEQGAAKRPPTREELAASREQAELAQMRAQLAEVLDADPSIRPELRHLAYIEQALQQHGLRPALYKVPLDVLKRAHEQFEGLVTNWEPRGLATLRSKMAVAVIDREAQDHAGEADARATAAVLDVAPPARAAPATKNPVTLRRL